VERQPAAFSRLMDTIMEGALNVITYLDDVLVHSATHEAHIAHLRHNGPTEPAWQ
jgi:hypothetical protein